MERAGEDADATAESFGPWRWPSPMVDRLGDLRCHRTDPARFGFVVDEPKLNGRGYLHAGALSTIADVVIGHSLASMAIGDVRFVTTALEIHFLGTGRRGEWIDVSVTAVRIGGRQAVGTALFTNGDRPIGFATATFMPP